MKVDVRCKKCAQEKRLEIGKPAPGQGLADYLRILHDRSNEAVTSSSDCLNEDGRFR